MRRGQPAKWSQPAPRPGRTAPLPSIIATCPGAPSVMAPMTAAPGGNSGSVASITAGGGGEQQRIILAAVQGEIQPVVGECLPQGGRRRNIVDIDDGGHPAGGAQLAQVVGQPVADVHSRNVRRKISRSRQSSRGGTGTPGGGRGQPLAGGDVRLRAAMAPDQLGRRGVGGGNGIGIGRRRRGLRQQCSQPAGGTAHGPADGNLMPRLGRRARQGPVSGESGEGHGDETDRRAHPHRRR